MRSFNTVLQGSGDRISDPVRNGHGHTEGARILLLGSQLRNCPMPRATAPTMALPTSRPSPTLEALPWGNPTQVTRIPKKVQYSQLLVYSNWINLSRPLAKVFFVFVCNSTNVWALKRSNSFEMSPKHPEMSRRHAAWHWTLWKFRIWLKKSPEVSKLLSLEGSPLHWSHAFQTPSVLEMFLLAYPHPNVAPASPPKFSPRRLLPSWVNCLKNIFKNIFTYIFTDH